MLLLLLLQSIEVGLLLAAGAEVRWRNNGVRPPRRRYLCRWKGVRDIEIAVEEADEEQVKVEGRE